MFAPIAAAVLPMLSNRMMATTWLPPCLALTGHSQHVSVPEVARRCFSTPLLRSGSKISRHATYSSSSAVRIPIVTSENSSWAGEESSKLTRDLHRWGNSLEQPAIVPRGPHLRLGPGAPSLEQPLSASCLRQIGAGRHPRRINTTASCSPVLLCRFRMRSIRSSSKPKCAKMDARSSSLGSGCS